MIAYMTKSTGRSKFVTFTVQHEPHRLNAILHSWWAGFGWRDTRHDPNILRSAVIFEDGRRVSGHFVSILLGFMSVVWFRST